MSHDQVKFYLYRLASLERARSEAKPKSGPESQGSGKTLALNFSWQMAPSEATRNLISALQAIGKSFDLVIIALPDK